MFRAALHIPYYTAYAGLVHYAKILPSETVLIHGATGAVGLAAVQVRKAIYAKKENKKRKVLIIFH
jgi:NADPH:quinone reductase-like Zn-dependent oxidoreductase